MSHNMVAIAGRLREAGYRVTPQRQLILDSICAQGGHVTPEAVYEHVRTIAPTLSQATVYRTLHFLTEQGILTITQVDGGRFGYELAGPEPHHHLVCRACQASIELSHATLRPLYHAIEAQHDFAIDMNHVTFFGLCADCRHVARR
ncbi:MAG: transcriptional repressor [Chloroflexi bacterium]|nr:transcriptional repressor [Chloroflexota bacterium]MCI0579872.1 transcriptional repressor [Chloroflexota bacterium]MCI0646153.1 transcriptional repressor [Chloroflexota bacterium]MCI0729863.1 transcriptional repressor [Chloroflexota bacterium]